MREKPGVRARHEMQQKAWTAGRLEKHRAIGMPENRVICPEEVPVLAVMRSKVQAMHRNQTGMSVVARQAIDPCEVTAAAIDPVAVPVVAEEDVDWRGNYEL